MLAVLVAHDGARWLPRVLRSLERCTARPAHLVGVDTGSTDGSADLLRAACDTVLELPRSTGYGQAVAAGVAAAPGRPAFLWLLHDDTAPRPGALAALLREARRDPSAVLLGPKAVDLDRPAVLREVGLRVDPAGRRVTGVAPDERDQGQADDARDVLAVSTAGALVRRAAWDALGGLDPAVPLLGDDLDLGWRVRAAGGRVVVVPAAVVPHAAALRRGLRAGDALGDVAPEVAERAHALQLAVVAAPRALLLPRLLAVVLATVLRALGALAVRAPHVARRELGALSRLRPGVLRARRRRHAATRRLPEREVRRWRAPRRLDLRERLTRPTLPSGLGAGSALLGVLLLLALLAERQLLGSGPLVGGRLGAGSAAAAALVLLSVPLAGASAFLSLSRVAPVPARAAAAAVWALSPVGTGAVVAGRLDAAVAQVLLPPALLAAALLVRAPTWPRAARAGLVLSLLAWASPPAWLLLALVLLLAARLAGRVRHAAAAVALPVLLLLPAGLLPSLAHGAGVLDPALSEPVALWRLLLLDPAGPGTPWPGLTAGVLLLALIASVRGVHARRVRPAWALALLGLLAAGLLARTEVGGALVWPGAPLQLAAAGLLLAALPRARTALAVLAGTAVALGLAWVLPGSSGPLERDPAPLLPAYADAALADGTRALVLRPEAGGVVVGVLGAGDTAAEPAPAALRAAAQDLLAGVDVPLAARGVRWVVLAAPTPELRALLDAGPTLRRQGDDPLPLWASTGEVAVPERRAPGPTRVPAGLLLLGALVLAAPAVRVRTGLEP